VGTEWEPSHEEAQYRTYFDCFLEAEWAKNSEGDGGK